VLISVRGMLAWSAVFALVGYFAGAAVLHAKLAREPFNKISYNYLIAPWRWKEIPSLRGEAFLAQARENFGKGRHGEAFALLRMGLARRPGDADSRLILAGYYASFLRRDLGVRVLFEGLRHGIVTEEYLGAAISYLQEADLPHRTVEFCREARTTAGLADSSWRLLDSAETGALLEIGEIATARRFVSALAAPEEAWARRLRLQVALARRDFDAALEDIRNWTHRQPADPELWALYVGICRQAGRFSEMDTALARLRALNPSRPGFATMSVVQNQLAGRSQEAAAALDELLFRFGSNRFLLEGLASELGSAGGVDLLKRLERAMNEHGHNVQQVQFGRLVAQMEAADWDQARVTRDLLGARRDSLAPAIKQYVQISEALIDYCMTGASAAKSTVLEQLAKHDGRLRLYLQIADCMMAAGRVEGASEALVLAEGAYPESHRIEQRRRQVEAALATVRAEKKPGLVQADVSPVVSAPSFFQAIDADMAAGRAEEALRNLDEAKRRMPSWWEDKRIEIEQREIALCVLLEDLSRLKLAVSQALRDAGSQRSEELLVLAERAHAEKKIAASRVILTEIVRRWPDHGRARAALASTASARAQEARGDSGDVGISHFPVQ
ncbi:MAG: hypothetical protein RLZZ50_603, partial [Verrucomicrobiota bacterium]